MKKKWLKILIGGFAALMLLPLFMLCVGIPVANNCVANAVKNVLKSYPLPDKTVLTDSLSAAGKLVGNGNGMQYLGAILVTSDLSKQEISEHYSKEFDYVEVYRQTSRTIPSLRPNSCSFKHFDHTDNQKYYSVIYWGSKHDYVNTSFSWLLDFDLRGH